MKLVRSLCDAESVLVQGTYYCPDKGRYASMGAHKIGEVDGLPVMLPGGIVCDEGTDARLAGEPKDCWLALED